MHAEEIQTLKAKLKKAEHLEKEWGSNEKSFQDKITTLEGRMKEHEDSYAVEVVEIKEALAAKVREAENLEGEVAK